MSTNIQELARHLQVSVATISRALTGKPGVSERRRKDILAAAKEMGYEPDMQARALRSGQRIGITVLTRSVSSQVESLRSNSLIARLNRHFPQVSIQALAPGESVDQGVRKALAQSPQVLVMIGMGFDPEKFRKLPPAVVVMDGQCDGLDGVWMDRSEGTRVLTRLILLGKRQYPLYVVQGSLEKPESRLQGILQAYAEIGLTIKPEQVVALQEGSYNGGYQQTRELLQQKSFDALFAYNDEFALGALRALHEAKVKVPEDLWLAGFDNLPVSGFSIPSLTTVRQTVGEMADEVLKLIQYRLQNPDAETQHVILKPEVMVRESCPFIDYQHRMMVFQNQEV